MDPAIIAAGISAGANLIGTGVSSNLNSRNRRFNANQAQLNRDFQAQQSELARDWQERFYQQYQSPGALVRQGKEAGIHPYAALGMSPTGASATSVPQGSQASSGQVLDPQHSISNIANTMLNLLELKSRIDLNESQANKNNAEATGLGIDNNFKPQLLEQQLRRGEVEISNFKAGIEQIESMTALNKDQLLSRVVDRDLKQAEIGKVIAETDKIILSNATERLKQENIKITNRKLAQEILYIRAETGLSACKATLTRLQQGTEKNKMYNLALQNFELEWKKSYRELNRHDPDSGTFSLVLQCLTSTYRAGESILKSIF